MKTPRVQDFDPTAKVPQLGSPMDNLPSIQLPEKKPESLNTRKEESLKGRKEEIMKSGKPESLVSGNQAITNARKPESRKVPKYSTQLPEELQIFSVTGNGPESPALFKADSSPHFPNRFCKRV